METNKGSHDNKQGGQINKGKQELNKDEKTETMGNKNTLKIRAIAYL